MRSRSTRTSTARPPSTAPAPAATSRPSRRSSTWVGTSPTTPRASRPTTSTSLSVCPAPSLHPVANNNLEVTRYLLENGQDPNFVDSSRVTPLILASVHTNPEMIALLLKHNADATVCVPRAPDGVEVHQEQRLAPPHRLRDRPLPLREALPLPA